MHFYPVEVERQDPPGQEALPLGIAGLCLCAKHKPARYIEKQARPCTGLPFIVPLLLQPTEN